MKITEFRTDVSQSPYGIALVSCKEMATPELVLTLTYKNYSRQFSWFPRIQLPKWDIRLSGGKRLGFLGRFTHLSLSWSF